MATVAQQQMYRDEYVEGFAVRETRLRDTVTTETMTKGNQTYFLVSNPTRSAVTRGANGRIPAAVDDLSQIPVALQEKHDLPQKTNFNIFTGQSDQRKLMQKESQGVINRDIDQTIIATLAAGTLTTGAAAPMSKALINRATTKLWNNNVPMDGMVYGLITPAAWAYLSDLASFASSDYVSDRPLENGPTMKDWMNVKWMPHTLLPGVGTNAAKCFIWHKAAVGHAINAAGIDARAGYDEEQDYSWARTTFYHGAAVIQNTGIVAIPHDDSGLSA